MKLAEAKFAVAEIDGQLAGIKERLPRSSLLQVSSLLDEFNTLVRKKGKLLFAVEKAESENSSGGTSIKEFQILLAALEENLETWRFISRRTDLTEELMELVFSNIDAFSHTKSQLQSSLQKISWEVEVNL